MPTQGRSDPGHGSPSRYPGTFLLAFREGAASLQWQVRGMAGHLVECVDAAGEEHIVGMENLYRRVRKRDRGQWPALIEQFLRTVAEGVQAEELPANLADVQDRVLVRLGPPLQTQPGEEPVWAEGLPGVPLQVSLVIDYPSRMVYVTQDMIAASGKSGPDWLAIALENLRKRTPDKPFTVINEETGFLACSVADSYDSARALLLDKLLPDQSRAGFIVGIPGRDQLVVLPVSKHAPALAPLLKMIVDKHHTSVPYPISNEVFWVHEGKWHLLKITIEKDKATVEPPDELVAILNNLTNDQESGKKFQ